MTLADTYYELSLTARLAVALHCFSQYCEKHNLRHPLIDSFLDDLWEFPVVGSERWDDWENNHPELVGTGLGDPWPTGFEAFLNAQAIDLEQFRHLISSVVEIVFSSFYGASDNNFSLKCLSEVLKMVNVCGINPPPAEVFRGSRFADRAGWGNQMTVTERDAWRAVGPNETCT